MIKNLDTIFVILNNKIITFHHKNIKQNIQFCKENNLQKFVEIAYIILDKISFIIYQKYSFYHLFVYFIRKLSLEFSLLHTSIHILSLLNQI